VGLTIRMTCQVSIFDRRARNTNDGRATRCSLRVQVRHHRADDPRVVEFLGAVARSAARLWFTGRCRVSVHRPPGRGAAGGGGMPAAQSRGRGATVIARAVRDRSCRFYPRGPVPNPRMGKSVGPGACGNGNHPGNQDRGVVARRLGSGPVISRSSAFDVGRGRSAPGAHASCRPRCPGPFRGARR
jgi:hypothetical protein